MKLFSSTRSLSIFALLAGSAISLGVSAANLVEKTTFEGDRSGVTSVVFSPNGSRLFSGGWENSIKQWDPNNGSLISTIDHTGFGDLILDLDISPDGRTLVSGSRDYDNRKNTVKLWNIRSGNAGKTLRRPVPEFCDSTSFSPDGKQVAAGCWDGKNGERTLQIWNAQNGSVVETIYDFGGPVAYSPSSKQLAAGDGSTLKTLNVGSRQTVQTFTGQILSADFNHNGRQLVTGDASGSVVVWDAKTGRQSVSLKGHSDAINDIAYSADGKYIISGSKDASVRLWDSQTGRQLSVARTKDPVESVSFGPKGKRIAIASGTAIKIYQVTGTTSGGPPPVQQTNVSGKWKGPNGEDFSLKQRGTNITVIQGSKTLGTVTIAGNIISWGTVKGTVRGTTISWTNNTKWKKAGGTSSSSSGSSSSNSAPPSGVKVTGKWKGPNGENFDLRQSGSKITVRENSKTIATIQIKGNIITWGTVKGTVRGNTISWTNNTKWKKAGGTSSSSSGSSSSNSAPPSGVKVTGKWKGPNGENFDLRQSGSKITVRENSKTIATIQIKGNIITWGATKGTVRGNSISWSNNTKWKKAGGTSSSSSGSSSSNSAPPSGVKVTGKWKGPNGENFDLRQSGSKITVRENSKTIATIQIKGNIITWGTVKGTVRGSTISWTNNTKWKKAGGTSSSSSSSAPPSGTNAPPSGVKVTGKWKGPNGENFDLRQSGSKITVRENSKTIATIQIKGNIITWGATKGTVRGNSISWSNNTKWKKAGTTGSSSGSNGPPTSSAPPIITRYEETKCKSKLFLYWECGYPGAKTVEVIKQHSTVMCEKDVSYGLTDKGLWVTFGCNANFRLGFE